MVRAFSPDGYPGRHVSIHFDRHDYSFATTLSGQRAQCSREWVRVVPPTIIKARKHMTEPGSFCSLETLDIIGAIRVDSWLIGMTIPLGSSSSLV